MSKLSRYWNIKVFDWIGGVLIFAYIVWMVIWPLINTCGDWQIVENKLYKWQSLNAGMLAFISSIIVFSISRYNAEQKRDREFRANRSFLPESFAELTIYCKESMAVYAKAWNRVDDQSGRCNTPLDAQCPRLPESYRGVFKECISVAEPEVGERLSCILSLLQVLHARLTRLCDDSENNRIRIRRADIISNFYLIAKIQALIYKMFKFARGWEDFDRSALVWKDYEDAVRSNDIFIVVHFDEFWDLFKKEVEGRNNSDESA